jgi:hypothetical protein
LPAFLLFLPPSTYSVSDPSSPIPGIISQQLFDHYSAGWLEVISQPDVEALQAGFRQDGLHLTGVGFSITQVARLVATVGAVHIKARFIMQPPKPGTQPQFSLALFAADALDARISSYYVPETVYTDTAGFTRPSRPGKLPIHKNQVHHVLAERWRQSWADLTEVLPEYFAAHYGPLRGYTFELNEFVALFLLLETLGGEMLKVFFVLHDYYKPEPSTSGDQLAKTFALALSLKRSENTKCAADFQDGDDPIMDTAMPCPPQC